MDICTSVNAKMKHAILLTGTKPEVYWIANYLADYTIYSVFMPVIIAATLLFGPPAYTHYAG